MKKFINSRSFTIPVAAFALFLVQSFSVPMQAQGTVQSEIDQHVKGLPFSMASITVPQFGEKSYMINAYGAIADGKTLATSAINDAISACNANGGGRVTIPAGMWLTGPITLKSNVDLHLEKGALVIFTKDHSAFPTVLNASKAYETECPINGSFLTNVAVTGEGVFDGNGDTWRPVKKNKLTESQWKSLVKSGGCVTEKGDMWWPSPEAMNAENYLKQKRKGEMTREDYDALKDFYRPNLFNLEHCKNVYLDGITLQNSPKFALYIRGSENIILRRVTVNNEAWAQNGDGLDISACKNVLLLGCVVSAGDDAICMKSSVTKGSSYAMENVVVADCIVYNGHGGFVIGSNTDGGIRNVSVTNCTFLGTDVGLRFKSGIGRGGMVENIFIDGIYMKNIAREAILFEYEYEDKGAVKLKDQKVNDNKVPQFRNFQLQHIYCDGAETAFSAQGIEESPLEHVSLNGGLFRTMKGIEGKFMHDISFQNLHIEITDNALFTLANSTAIQLQHISHAPAGILLQLSGEQNSGISVEDCDTKSVRQVIAPDAQSNKGNVQIK
jgi:polygalacturonase